MNRTGKADLLVWSADTISTGHVTMHPGGSRWQRYQFKTAQQLQGQTSFKLQLTSWSASRDNNKGPVYANSYRAGDADYYIAVLPAIIAAGA